MGIKALELITKNFLSKTIFKKYENMYKELINEGFINTKN